MLTVSINGKTVQFNDQPTVAELLLQQVNQPENDNKQVAVAVNGEFVPRSRYTQTYINNNDAIDIVTAVGGG